MSLFVNIEPVPFRLLDDLANQMDANNEALKARQGEKGSTDRPSAQRAAHNADQSTYRRPEPAASPRGNDLSVFWIYYGGDGREWVMNANGTSGWQLSYTSLPDYNVEDWRDPDAPRRYFDQNRDNFLELVNWSNPPKEKTWSPEYGSKGRYGDWYDYRRTSSISFAIKENSVDPVFKELYIDFINASSTRNANSYYANWVSTGRESAAIPRVRFKYLAAFYADFCRILEQSPLIYARYWAQLAYQGSAGPFADTDYVGFYMSGKNSGNVALTKEKVGIDADATASLTPSTAFVNVSAIIYNANRWFSGGATLTCPDVSWGGNTCPFDVDPPVFDWGLYGWPERKFDNTTTLKNTYSLVNPFFVNGFSGYYIPTDDGGTELALRADGKIIGDGPYQFGIFVAGATEPFYRDDYFSFITDAGFSWDGFSAWSGAFTDFKFWARFATPDHLNYLASVNGDESPLVPPTWEWSPDTTKGGFALDLTQSPGQIEAMHALMASGSLSFVRSDGKRTTIRVGGADVPLPPDEDPEFRFSEMLVSTNWDKPALTRSMARQYGLI